jgi:hypothetical protein
VAIVETLSQYLIVRHCSEKRIHSGKGLAREIQAKNRGTVLHCENRIVNKQKAKL